MIPSMRRNFGHPPKIFFSIFRFSTLELVEIDPNAAADPTQARSRAVVSLDQLRLIQGRRSFFLVGGKLGVNILKLVHLL